RRREPRLDGEPGPPRILDDTLQRERTGDVDATETSQVDAQRPSVGVLRQQLDEAVLEDPGVTEPEDAEWTDVQLVADARRFDVEPELPPHVHANGQSRA